MKTNQPTTPRPPTRPTLARPAPPPRRRPPAPRPVCEFLDFCLYPGMQPAATAPTFPTAI